MKMRLPLSIVMILTCLCVGCAIEAESSRYDRIQKLLDQFAAEREFQKQPSLRLLEAVAIDLRGDIDMIIKRMYDGKGRDKLLETLTAELVRVHEARRVIAVEISKREGEFNPPPDPFPTPDPPR